jgi:hypothetical protein
LSRRESSLNFDSKEWIEKFKQTWDSFKKSETLAWIKDTVVYIGTFLWFILGAFVNGTTEKEPPKEELAKQAGLSVNQLEAAYKVLQDNDFIPKNKITYPPKILCRY